MRDLRMKIPDFVHSKLIQDLISSPAWDLQYKYQISSFCIASLEIYFLLLYFFKNAPYTLYTLSGLTFDIGIDEI